MYLKLPNPGGLFNWTSRTCREKTSSTPVLLNYLITDGLPPSVLVQTQLFRIQIFVAKPNLNFLNIGIFGKKSPGLVTVFELFYFIHHKQQTSFCNFRNYFSHIFLFFFVINLAAFFYFFECTFAKNTQISVVFEY